MGEFAFGRTSLTWLRLPLFFTVKGFYSDSVNEKTKQKYHMKQAAIIHIDCDLYTSTRAVLKFIESLIVPGTILIFDDWDAFKNEDVENMGERKACKEWTHV